MNRWTIIAFAVALCGTAARSSAISSASSTTILHELTNQAAFDANQQERQRRSYEDETNSLTAWHDGTRLNIGPRNVVSKLRGWGRNDAFLPNQQTNRRRRTAPELDELEQEKNLSEQLETWIAATDEWINEYPLRRKQRQSMTGIGDLISGPLIHPFDYVFNLMGAFGEYASDELIRAISETLHLMWRFITQRGLPQLHRILNSVDQTIPLPTFLRVFIQNFNAMYSLARLLGYVN